MISNFSFLKNNYPELFLISELSEKLYYVDPSSSLAKLRLFSEKMTILIWKFEDLGIFDGNQVDRINQLYYKNTIPEVVKDLLHTVRKSGNKASHDGSGTNTEALFILKKCYQLARWFYETYENDFLEKDAYALPENNEKNTLDDLNAKLEKLSREVIDYQTKVASFNASPEIISKRKEKSNRNANNIHLDEADTRTILIDKQLVAAGWECDSLTINYKNNKTVPEKGKNKAIAEWPCQGKWADYALFVGLELYGIVEAKKYATDISTDLHQSKVYAERLELASHFKTLGEWNSYKVPFLFSTNGRTYLEQIKTKSGIWFLDIRKERNKAQALRGWLSPQGIVEQFERDVEKAFRRKKIADSIELFLQFLRMICSFALLVGNIRKTFIPAQFR